MASSFEQVTVGATAVGLDIAKSGDSFFAILRLQDAQIRFRLDGTAPTSTVGTPLEVGDILTLTSDEAARFQAIRTGSTSGVLNCSYEDSVS